MSVVLTILRNQFSLVGGLYSTFRALSPTDECATVREPVYCYIVHFKSKHWVALVDKCDENYVKVYDSLVEAVSIDKLEEKVSLYSKKECLRVRIQQQKNTIDCGLYAIAALVDVLFEEDPFASLYDEMNMRAHCANCVSNGHFTRFGCIARKPSTSTQGKYSISRLPIFSCH
jgi:hypothetical protein